LIADIQQKALQLFNQHGSTVLTAGGVVGTVGTAVLTGRASYKAGEIVTRERVERDVPDIPTKEKVAMTWPLFLPPVGVGGVTIVSIIMAHRISAMKIAALATAYGISEKRFEEYRTKALERLGVNKETKLRDDIAQDRVNDNPPDGQVIIIGGNDVLCYDMLTGRYFKSNVEALMKAQNYINNELFHYQSASLSQFFEEVGLPPTNYTDTVGWSQIKDGQLEVKISTVRSPDDKPCLAVDFNNLPHPDYTQLF
jgi:hypothetical protein